METTSLAGVLSGKDAVKVEVGINTNQIIIAGVVFFVLGAILIIISKKI